MQLPDLSLLIALAVFWATYHVLKATVFKPLGEVLGEREKTVVSATTALQGAFDRQAEVLADVDRRLLDARRGALAQREAVRAEAAARRQELLDAARAEARRAADKAQAELDAAAAAARAQLAADARSTAAELASTLLGRRVA